LLAAGVASLAMVALFAATQLVSSDARRTDVGHYATSTLAYALNRANAAERFPPWTVTKANSAHHALVVDVEARHVEDARKIAEEIVSPMRSRGYQEVLIYVYPVNDPKGAMRRVQWTPRTGFIETLYGPLP
jgi:hypothetical protein